MAAARFAVITPGGGDELRRAAPHYLEAIESPTAALERVQTHHQVARQRRLGAQDAGRRRHVRSTVLPVRTRPGDG